MRERHALYGNTGSYIGITPARAGKTLHFWSVLASGVDHPRSCGKDFYMF